ncbi:MAG: class I SAM-dependent methyltransferase [Bacteroidota bacterium]
MSTPPIKYINPTTKQNLLLTEKGLSDEQGNIIFPKQNNVYKLVNSDNYTSNFGFQWKKFKKTQLDKFSGLNFSKDRFFAVTNWDKEDLTNKTILEAGSGAGRFSQIVLDYTKANLYTLDYSEAVEANAENNQNFARATYFQASIFDMPFANCSFDKVFCFGVLQHTGNPQQAIQCLLDMAKPGSEVVVDFYPYKGWYTKVNAKYLLRPFTKNMESVKLLNLIRKNVNWLIKFYNLLNSNFITRPFKRFVPICDISDTLPPTLTKEELIEWVVLDTFDMFSPAYDEPLKISEVVSYFKNAGAINVEGEFKTYGSNLKIAVVKGVKK